MGRKRRAMAGTKWKNRAKYSALRRQEAAEPLHEVVIEVAKNNEVVIEVAKNSLPAQPESEPKALPADPPEISLFNDPDPEPVKVVEVIEKPKPSRKTRKPTTRKRTTRKKATKKEVT